MAKEAKVGVNTSEAEGKFVKLQLQIRQTQVALQKAAEAGDQVKFNTLKGQLDELNDSLELTQLKSLQLDDALASQPGTLGQVGSAMKSYDATLKGFLANPVVAILAGIVGAFMALKEALSRTEEGQAKLTKVSEGFTKILNGLFAILEPIANMFIDLVIGLMENDKFMKGLTKTVGVLSGVFGGLFAVIKNVADLIINTLVNNFKTLVNVASGAGKVLKGIFTLDWDAIKEGVADVTNGIKDGFNNTVKNIKNFAVNTVTDVVDGYVAASESAEKSFTEGSKRLTEKEKKDKEERDKRNKEAAEKAKKAAQDLINTNEQVQQSNDELAESQRKKSESVIQALKDEQAYKDKEYERETKRIDDLMALEVKGSNEYKALLAQKNDLEAKYNNDRNARNAKLTEEEKKKAEEDKKLAEETAKALAVTDEQKYQKSLADTTTYYDELIKKNKDNAEVVAQLEKAKEQALLQIKSDYAQKANADRNALLEQELSNEATSFERKKEILAMQEQELLNQANLSEDAKLKIRRDFAQKNAQIDQQAFEAKQAITSAELDLAAQAGQFLQQIAGKNKGVAIAGIVVEQAAAIGKIIQNTAVANAKSVATFPITAGMPWVAINTASAALSIASSIAAGVKAINEIKSADTGGGGAPSAPSASAPAGSKFAKGGILVGPSHSEGGIKSPYGELEGGEFVINKRSTRSFMPLLNAINKTGNRKYAMGGMTPSMSDLQEMMGSQSQPIIKTYVVASEMTSAMEADKKIGDLARL